MPTAQNPVRYFNNEWWDIMWRPDREREALLNNDHKEVYHEMILQECQEGIKTHRVIAEEYNVHKATVSRIVNKKGRVK